jgi:peroxiredoxin
MREMKELSTLHPEFKQKGLRLVALTDDSPEKIEAVRQKLGIPFEMYPLEKTLHDYDIYTIPTAYVFDQNGKLVFEQVDAMDWTDRDFLDQLFDDLH